MPSTPPITSVVVAILAAAGGFGGMGYWSALPGGMSEGKHSADFPVKQAEGANFEDPALPARGAAEPPTETAPLPSASKPAELEKPVEPEKPTDSSKAAEIKELAVPETPAADSSKPPLPTVDRPAELEKPAEREKPADSSTEASSQHFLLERFEELTGIQVPKAPQQFLLDQFEEITGLPVPLELRKPDAWGPMLVVFVGCDILLATAVALCCHSISMKPEKAS